MLQKEAIPSFFWSLWKISWQLKKIVCRDKCVSSEVPGILFTYLVWAEDCTCVCVCCCVTCEFCRRGVGEELMPVEVEALTGRFCTHSVKGMDTGLSWEQKFHFVCVSCLQMRLRKMAVTVVIGSLPKWKS